MFRSIGPGTKWKKNITQVFRTNLPLTQHGPRVIDRFYPSFDVLLKLKNANQLKKPSSGKQILGKRSSTVFQFTLIRDNEWSCFWWHQLHKFVRRARLDSRVIFAFNFEHRHTEMRPGTWIWALHNIYDFSQF